MLAAWLRDHFQGVWWAVFVACAVPAAALLHAFATQALGPNPLLMLLHTSGRSALVVLCLTLAITPLRRWLTRLAGVLHLRWGKRLADWNWLIRLRRMLGLWCFAYALAHGWMYAFFDLGYDWAAAWGEVQEKPYILAGAVALALLIPLAITSHTRMVRLLGRHWRRLHRLTYAVAVLALLHFWWMQKPGLWTPWPETLVLAVLLGYRLALHVGWLQRWDGFDGRESQERTPQTTFVPQALAAGKTP